MSEDSTSSAARLAGVTGAALLLLALLTGFYIAAAMGGRIHVEVHSAVAAHLNAFLGAFWLFGLGWTLPMLRYGPVGQRRLVLAVAFPNYANWLITAVKATLHVAGVDVSADPANNAVLAALTVFVVLPSLASAGAWIYGFRRG